MGALAMFSPLVEYVPPRAMGLFHLRCPASGLGIVSEPVVLVLVARDGDAFAPIAPPIRGQYDTYGSIESIEFGETTQRTLEGFVNLWETDQLHVPDLDPSNAFGELIGPKGLRGLLEYIRQGVIFESVRMDTAESTMVRAHGRDLGFVMFLAPIYDAVVEMIRDWPAGTEIMTRLTNSTFDGVIETTLAAPDPARSFVEDTSSTRDALLDFALFRSWFDARGSWPAGNAFSQYSQRELRTMVRDAKSNFAKWPLLVEAVEAYERASLRLAAG